MILKCSFTAIVEFLNLNKWFILILKNYLIRGADHLLIKIKISVISGKIKKKIKTKPLTPPKSLRSMWTLS